MKICDNCGKVAPNDLDECCRDCWCDSFTECEEEASDNSVSEEARTNCARMVIDAAERFNIDV